MQSPTGIPGLGDLAIPGYEIMRILGQGGSGIALLCRQLRVSRQVVVKVSATEGREVRHRFEREARILAALRDPAVAPLLDFGEIGSRVFLVYPYEEGKTLEAVLATKGRWEWRRVRNLARQIAGALAYLHSNNILHRDLKPANILIRTDETAQLLDFGTSHLTGDTRLTAEGEFMGTPSHVPPELIEGADLSAAGDLYSLGVILVECLFGENPFAGDSVEACLARQLNLRLEAGDPRFGTAPEAFSGLILELLRKRPADRPAGAAVVMERLDSLALAPISRPLRGTALAPVSSPAPAPPSRGPRGLVATGLLLVAALALVFFPRGRPIVPPSVVKSPVASPKYEYLRVFRLLTLPSDDQVLVDFDFTGPVPFEVTLTPASAAQPTHRVTYRGDQPYFHQVFRDLSRGSTYALRVHALGNGGISGHVFSTRGSHGELDPDNLERSLLAKNDIVVHGALSWLRGNLGPRAIRPLRAFLKRPDIQDPWRIELARSLHSLRDLSLAEEMLSRTPPGVEKSRSPQDREMMATCLASCRHPSARAYLYQLLADGQARRVALPHLRALLFRNVDLGEHSDGLPDVAKRLTRVPSVQWLLEGNRSTARQVAWSLQELVKLPIYWAAYGALGLVGDGQDVPRLAAIAKGPKGPHRQGAVFALCGLENSSADAALLSAYGAFPLDRDLLWAVGRRGVTAAAPQILSRFQDTAAPQWFREEAALVLGLLGDRRAIGQLREEAVAATVLGRNALWALARMGDTAALPIAVARVDSDLSGVAIWALGQLPYSKYLPKILEVLEKTQAARDKLAPAREALAIFALSRIAPERPLRVLPERPAIVRQVARILQEMDRHPAGRRLHVLFPFMLLDRTGLKFDPSQWFTLGLAGYCIYRGKVIIPGTVGETGYPDVTAGDLALRPLLGGLALDGGLRREQIAPFRQTPAELILSCWDTARPEATGFDPNAAAGVQFIAIHF